MKRTVLAATTAAVLATLAPAAWSADAAEGRSPDLSNGRLRLDDGRKWATDEALRRHMADIRAALSPYRASPQPRMVWREDGQRLGAVIDGKVIAILTESRLPPEAAHNMHLVVADLVRASDVLQGRAEGSPVKGVNKAMRAVHMYATYFDHPGWKPAVVAALPAAAVSHGHAHGASARSSLDAGRKWATDEPLRRQMSELRDALAYAQKGPLPAAEYRGLGDVMEFRIARIVDECKLSPEADANLHVIVGELVGAADALREEGGQPHAAIHRATLALNAYGRHFEHPGWKPLP
jgi:hypothetical protein